MEEVWKDIKEFEGVYQISNLGRIKRLRVRDTRGHLRKEKILKTYLNSCGYYHVGLTHNNIQTKRTVHRLLMEAFNPNPNPDIYTDINHINEIKTDNSLSNLEWCTHKENMNSGTAEQRALINSMRTKHLKKLLKGGDKDETR